MHATRFYSNGVPILALETLSVRVNRLSRTYIFYAYYFEDGRENMNEKTKECELVVVFEKKE